MQITAIASEANPLLRKVRGLHQRSNREKLGLFLLEGAKLVTEALSKDVRVQDVIVSKSYLSDGLPISLQENLSALIVVEDRYFKELSTTATPSGILAVARMQKYSMSDLTSGRCPLVVIAEAIQDPGNVGTMMRTALAFGATGIVLSKGSVDPYNPKVVRGAMGALFSLPFVTDIETISALDILKKAGLTAFAFAPRAQEPFWQADFTQPTALILGNEGQGLTAATMGKADRLVNIPMHDQSESLNVAVCAAIVLFDCARQRSSALR